MKKIKNSIESVQFNDGFLYLCRLNDNGDIDYASKRLYYYGIRNLTQKRLDEAAQLQEQYDLAVHIPLESVGACRTYDCVLLRGVTYRIMKVQEVYTTNPPIAILTLSVWEMEV
ncbi:MAG: hypothetical protein NC120_05090 [Ruminococcus sp.]|nr:hypothetical protein [Ruminococcus sp.]